MMDKKYTFKDDSWWDQPGCDCCEGYLSEAYNLVSSIYDCYALALQLETGLSEEYFYDLSMEDLTALAEDNNIIVEIIQ